VFSLSLMNFTYSTRYVPMWRGIFVVLPLCLCLFPYLSLFDYFVLCRCVCYHIYVVQAILIIILYNCDCLYCIL